MDKETMSIRLNEILFGKNEEVDFTKLKKKDLEKLYLLFAEGEICERLLPRCLGRGRVIRALIDRVKSRQQEIELALELVKALSAKKNKEEKKNDELEDLEQLL